MTVRTWGLPLGKGRSGLILATAAIMVIGFCPPAKAEIQNTHHDFTTLTGSGEICKPCHTPHNAKTNITAAPLWNHEDTVATFTPYDSSTMDASPGQPTGTSRLCLSCHDGTIAINAFGGQPGTVYMTDPGYGGPGNGGSLQGLFTPNTLDRHHPISFDYTTALATADTELHDPSTTPSGLGGTIEEDLLHNGRMECTSCHDVHVGRATGCGSCHFGTPTKSLWKSNTGSALCLTCHNK